MILKTMPSSPKNNRKKMLKWILIAACIVGVIWGGFAGLVAWTNWVYVLRGPEYQAAEARCGHKPVITTTDMTGSGSYYLLPTDKQYQGPLGGLSLCTEKEALDKGFKHDPAAESDVAISKCQGAPVITLIEYNGHTNTYDHLYQLPASIHSIPGGIYDKYFCTEQEAIDAGYTKDPERTPYGN